MEGTGSGHGQEGGGAPGSTLIGPLQPQGGWGSEFDPGSCGRGRVTGDRQGPGTLQGFDEEV